MRASAAHRHGVPSTQPVPRCVADSSRGTWTAYFCRKPREAATSTPSRHHATIECALQSAQRPLPSCLPHQASYAAPAPAFPQLLPLAICHAFPQLLPLAICHPAHSPAGEWPDALPVGQCPLPSARCPIPGAQSPSLSPGRTALQSSLPPLPRQLSPAAACCRGRRSR
jgi:hypothetical protein